MSEIKAKEYVYDNAQLMAEWDWEKNEGIDPKKLSWCSGKKVWWRCESLHSYQAPISRRANGGGCPYCSGRLAITGENDLTTLFPEIAAQWHYERNYPINPTQVKPQSNKKVWWICELGHEYEAVVGKRIRGDACPYCSNHRILEGYNDLATLRPELAKEWHPLKNGDLAPNMISPNGDSQVWWLCSTCGFEWKVRVNARRGCPRCSAKRMTSFPEQAIYYYISQIYPDAINRYKYHEYELDIYIPSISTAIEYDGSFYHNSERAQRKDNTKDDLCAKEGIRLIRFRDPQLPSTTKAEIIACTDSYRTSEFEYAILQLFSYLDSEYTPDVSINRDRKIIEGKSVHYYKGISIADLFPEIAKEWNYSKNDPLDPHSFTPGSGRKVWWLCNQGHEWEATIGSRTSGTGCPYCSGKRVISGINDLLTLRPDIASEWNYTKNTPLLPEQVNSFSNKRVWWICSNCKKEWQTSISNKKQLYCRECRFKFQGEQISSIAAMKNNLAMQKPEFARQWHPLKNGSLKPSDVSCGSGRKIWWICDLGHEWQSSVSNRVKGNLGCPFCGNQKVLIGHNDFATFYPELSKEWNYERNEGVMPYQLVRGSGKKVWWKCSFCSYEWLSEIRNRIKHSKCPNCNNSPYDVKE